MQEGLFQVVPEERYPRMGWYCARELPELQLTTSASDFAMAYGNLMCGDQLDTD